MHQRTVRTVAALAAVLLLLTVAGPAVAAEPDQGRITGKQRTLTYDGGPFAAPNRTDPVLGDGSTLQCAPQAAPCDAFALTVALPTGFVGRHADARIRVALVADNGTSDYDLYVRDASGGYVAIGYNAGGSESVEFAASDGKHTYTVLAVPYSNNAGTYTARVTLLAADPAQDSDGDGVPDSRDACPGTPAGAEVNRKGCSGQEVTVPSAPNRPRAVVSVIDSAINPYHDFFYSRPSTVTREVLRDLGVKPANVVKLTRTGDFAADLAADAGFWSRVRKGELYHFLGTNIIATSHSPSQPYLKPTTAKNPHGVGTTAAVLTANPNAIILFVEANDGLGSAASHAAALKRPAVDIVTTSYGVSLAAGLLPAPEYRAFEHTYEGVVTRGKLHFSSAGNGPGVSALRAGAGPWWSIGVSGIQERESEGDTVLSGNLADFVSDFTQTLPYCMDCQTGTSSVSGTSFSTPRSAGLASKALLEIRRDLRHVGGIRMFGGEPVMAGNSRRSVSNWELRRALEQAAWTSDSVDYDPAEAPAGGVGVPVNPAAPWLQIGWGDLSRDGQKGVVSAALAELGYGDGDKRAKPTGYCEFQTQVVLARKAWWDSVAPAFPDNPVFGGEVPPGAPANDPFVYCTSVAP